MSFIYLEGKEIEKDIESQDRWIWPICWFNSHMPAIVRAHLVQARSLELSLSLYIGGRDSSNSANNYRSWNWGSGAGTQPQAL